MAEPKLGLVPQSSDLVEQLRTQFLYKTPLTDTALNTGTTNANTLDGLKIADTAGLQTPLTDAAFAGTQLNPEVGLGQWFTDNKAMLGAGLGLGQLGLGFLNYQANKEGLESDLASAEQARRLNEERAQNKRDITSKAQAALRWGV